MISGIDIPVEEFGFTLHQPRIREIAIIGEKNYFLALSIFKMTKEQLKVENPEINNWILFTEALKQEVEDVKSVKVLLTNFLQLFIVGKLTIDPRSLTIDSDGVVVNIGPEQFDSFQVLIGEVGGASLLVPSEEQFKPKNARAAEIAEKMKKARKRLAATKPQAKSDGFLTRYVKAVAVATANSLQEVNNMTLLQLNELMQTYLNKESYDLEIKSRLAGAKSEDKLTHWMMAAKQNESVESIGTI